MYYKDMEVFKEAMNLVTVIYTNTNDFPQTEMFGLTNQIRRSVVSVPSNIAEGVVKNSDKETIRFLEIALGSLAELDTQLMIAENLKYLDRYNELSPRIKKVNALIKGVINYYKK